MEKSQKEKSEKIAESIREIQGEGTAVTVINGRKFPKGIPDFVMLFQLIGTKIAKKLSPSACKVLLYFVTMMQYSNHIGINQSTLSTELELSIRSISGAIKELKDLNIIIAYKDPQDGKRNVYLINPHAAWKGKIVNRQKHLKDSDPNQTNLLLEI